MYKPVQKPCLLLVELKLGRGWSDRRRLAEQTVLVAPLRFHCLSADVTRLAERIPEVIIFDRVHSVAIEIRAVDGDP